MAPWASKLLFRDSIRSRSGVRSAWRTTPSRKRFAHLSAGEVLTDTGSFLPSEPGPLTSCTFDTGRGSTWSPGAGSEWVIPFPPKRCYATRTSNQGHRSDVRRRTCLASRPASPEVNGYSRSEHQATGQSRSRRNPCTGWWTRRDASKLAEVD